METDISFKIAGEAGQGLQAIGYVLAKTLARGDLYVFANQDNESRIRGGHNFFQVRVSDKPVNAASNWIHLIVALDRRGVVEHRRELVPNGVIIFDGEKMKIFGISGNLLSVPFERLANEKTGKKIMANSVAIGAMLSSVRYDFDILRPVLDDVFRVKGSDVVRENIDAAKAGYDYATAHPNSKFNYVVQSGALSSDRLLINGNEALASGALISGCKFMSSYPMSPSTPIQQFFASKMKDYTVVFEQAEDEIAAINMAIGASFAGVRSMVATSGGGFSLMVEGISLSGMTETPVVVIICARPGPATGFPTRTEQAELEFIIHAGHGEFPRVVFAPGTPEQAFRLTLKAFNLADRYQIPAFILSDEYFSDSYYTADRFDTSRSRIERGEFFNEWNPDVQGEYKRHLITDSGISPRLVPGTIGGLVTTDSDEHTEDGRITELAEVRIANVRKRLKKFELLRNEIEAPYVYGPTDAQTVLIGWGSTYGPLKEATEILLNQNLKVRMMHFSEIWPFPAQPVIEELSKAKLMVSIESNATGQLTHLIRAETGIEIGTKILRFDGRPITPSYITQEVESKIR